MIETDVLQGTHRLAPPVSDWLAETDRPVTVVANLPYVIASPLLALLTSAPGPITRIVVTIQREVAARLCAGPGNADYGALTVQVGYRASAERLFEVPAGAFWPKPAVRSEVVRLTPGPPEMRATDEPLFRRFVRAAFHHRRKKMLNSILNSSHFTDLLPSIEPPGPTLARLLAEIDVPPEIRADHLSIPQLVELSNRLAALIEPTK